MNKNKLLSLALAVLMLFGMLFFLTGCGQNDSEEENETEKTTNTGKKESAEDLYFKVLNNEIKYISEENKEMLFSEYMKTFENTSSNASTTISYALIDLDNDSENEMVVAIDCYDRFYLILNYEDENIYGFKDVGRGMISIKTDGTYMATGGAEVSAILKCKFDKTERITETLAESDTNSWKVNGKKADNAEFLEYLTEFNNKKEIKFTTFKENYNFNFDSSNSNNDNKVTFKEGKYTMTKPSLAGTEAEGYDTTITFNSGKVSYIESYWGNKKNGTYSVNGDTLTIKYTSGVEVNSITGEATVTLNETEIYKIDGKKLTLQSTTRDQYYKAGDKVFELK